MGLVIQHSFTVSFNIKMIGPVFIIFLWTTLFSQINGLQSICAYYESHTSANCSNRNLDYVPYMLHKKIIALDMSSNKLSILENKSFIDYVHITKLYLRNNSMHTINANAFQDLGYLKTLDLSNNKLSHVPTISINVVRHSLQQLILAGNKLSYIPAGAFSKLQQLTHLDLNGNRIYNLDRGAFAGLTSLTVFKIHHNAIKYLHSDAFEDFPRESMTQLQLYDNRWVCDCQLRWLWKWLNATASSVWESPGYPIRCDGPAIVRDESLDSLSLDKLACQVKMKTSGSTRELATGANTTLLCKYTTVPKVKAVWLKNSDEVDASSKKYTMSFTEDRDTRGNIMYVSELRINDFKYEDIAKYKCFIENIRGAAHTEYKLTLKGVDFDSVVVHPPVGQKADDSTGVDTMSIIIACAVVSGIILIIVIAVLIFCSVNRMQRKKQAKRDAIVEHVKEHFIKNSDVTGMGDNSTDKSKSSPLTRRLNDDGHNGNGTPNFHNPHHTPYRGGLPQQQQDDNRSCSNHTNDSTYKPPLDLEESEPMLIMSGHHSPGSPLTNNGNTYVSFGSEFTDPGEFPTNVPVYSNSHHQTPILGGGNRYDMPDGGVNGNIYGPAPGVAGSHEGSATPLLDRFTPVFLEDDPVEEDYASYPVYDSLTNSLQHPRHTTNTPPQHHPTNNHNNHIYNSIDGVRGGDKIYNTLPAHHQQHHPHPQQQIHPRGGSVNSSTNYNNNHNRSLGSQSSFNYPGSQSGGSMPRTPGSVRSVAAVPPWNSNSTSNPNTNNNSSSGPGNGSPPIIENHYQPPPLVHRPHPEYRDYRDMRYPITGPNPNTASLATPSSQATPPSNRDVTNTRNLGYSPVPSSGPRKPPRIYIPGSNGSTNGRDCIEMTTPVSAPQPPPSSHDSSNSSDYITSSEAQQYSKNYGITPGTPV